MKLTVKCVVLLVLATPLLAANADVRYSIATYPIAISRKPGQVQSNETGEALFKLDTALGSVWRLDTNGFQRILVRDLVSQKAFLEQQNDHVRKQLEAILIPEISFRDEPISNVVAFLQKQIRDRDPTIPPGSSRFLRLILSGENGRGGTIRFSAKDISALEALKIITDISGFQFRIEDDRVVITSLYPDEGFLIERIYEVSPALRDRVTADSITNIFAQLGFNLKDGARMIFSRELDTIVLGDTCWGHERFSETLSLAGIARQHTGRFRFMSAAENGLPILFLLDDKSGETWRYVRVLMSDGSLSESFDLIRTVP